MLLDGSKPEAAVHARSRQNDTDDAATIVPRKSAEQDVEGKRATVSTGRAGQPQGTTAHGQGRPGRDDE